MSKKIIITHSGSFHADDVFACASLSILLEKKQQPFKIIRTRNEKIIKTGDFIIDVGGKYNPAKNLFDHHQKEGASKRKNGIPYASFGLVWKKYGPEISNNKIVAQKIDRILIQPIDAGDNGTAYYKPLFGNILPYEFHSIFGAYSPSWKENTDLDKLFLKMVMLAKDIIKREIKKNTDSIEMEKIIENIYQNTYDKRIIVVTLPFSRFDIVNTLGKYKKPIYAIYPERGDKDWRIVGINKRPGSYLTRKPLPKSWAGKTGEAFRKVTGIKEAKFCHRTKFLAVADNKEGAIALARLSLNKK